MTWRLPCVGSINQSIIIARLLCPITIIEPIINYYPIIMGLFPIIEDLEPFDTTLSWVYLLQRWPYLCCTHWDLYNGVLRVDWFERGMQFLVFTNWTNPPLTAALAKYVVHSHLAWRDLRPFPSKRRLLLSRRQGVNLKALVEESLNPRVMGLIWQCSLSVKVWVRHVAHFVASMRRGMTSQSLLRHNHDHNSSS